MRFIYGKNNWRTLEQGEENCYLLTNGLGGFSSLTAIGSNARNDQALLMASLHAPTQRIHMVTNIHGEVHVKGRCYKLASQRYVNHSGDLKGYENLQSFDYEYLPRWQYQAGPVEIVEELFLKQDENTLCIKMEIRSSEAGRLLLTPWFQFVPKGDRVGKGQTFSLEKDQIMSNGYVLYYWTNGSVTEQDTVYVDDWYYEQDARDGRDAYGTAASNHRILCEFEPGVSRFYLVYSMSPLEHVDEVWVEEERCAEIRRQRAVCDQADFQDPCARMLSKSADQFLTRRESVDGQSLIAGYPFFGDWGRDTMIAMIGCTLSLRKYDTAKSILRTFMSYYRRGLMPNMFPEAGEEPLYNTVDASLLFFEVVYLYYQATKDGEFLTEAWKVMEDIIRCYKEGTDYNIHMDTDGLMIAGEELMQLTWMDVRYEDILPTPRHGKPVEINAYWYNALMIMAETAETVGREDRKGEYRQMAEHVKGSFHRLFWQEEKGYLKDVISGTKADTQIRCNQIWALTMSYPVVDEREADSILNVVYEHLYTPWGLRSLSPQDEEFHAGYGGTTYERDMAYHQGTVWAFPLGAYYLAKLRWSRDQRAAVQEVRRQLLPIEACLREGCIGQIAEIYDGMGQDTSRGCFAQGWSVGEILRVYERLEQLER